MTIGDKGPEACTCPEPQRGLQHQMKSGSEETTSRALRESYRENVCEEAHRCMSLCVITARHIGQVRRFGPDSLS